MRDRQTTCLLIWACFLWIGVGIILYRASQIEGYIPVPRFNLCGHE